MGRVLVIEDNQDNFDLLADAFEQEHTMIHAKDGTSGLNEAQTCDPDVILLDIALPEVDGLELARRIKNNPHMQHVPVIALTAHAMKGDRVRCLSSGCDDYVAKPIRIGQLREILDGYLSRQDVVASQA